MLTQLAKAGVQRLLSPVGATLARAGVSPDVVTIVGTVGVVVGSIWFALSGELLGGVVIVTLSTMTDLLDGAIARARGRQSKWGAFLDSTMDRISDGAIFGAVAYWLATENRFAGVAAALVCLVTGAVVPYAKARAEGLGLTCDVGFAGRTERLIILGIGALLEGFGVPHAIDVALWLLVALATVTIGQRSAVVWRQTHPVKQGVS